MVKLVEKNVATIIMITLFSIVLLSSCGSTKYGCGQASFIKNAHLCPAYHQNNNMKKIIVIAGVLLTTSCGMFSKMTEQEKELNYQIDKAYFEYSHKRDSLILEYYRK